MEVRERFTPDEGAGVAHLELTGFDGVARVRVEVAWSAADPDRARRMLENVAARAVGDLLTARGLE